MSIGGGIFLFVVGAILAFALNITVDWIDLDMVGYLLMGAGFIITMIGIALLARRRQSTTTQRTVHEPGSDATVTERRSSDTL